MKKGLKTLFVITALVSMLVLTNLIPDIVSASEMGNQNITVKDLKLENGKMIEIDGNEKLSGILPPLQELLPWNSYNIGLPSDTQNYATNQTGLPLDYVTVVITTGDPQQYTFQKDHLLAVIPTNAEIKMYNALEYGFKDWYFWKNNIFLGYLLPNDIIEVRLPVNHTYTQDTEIQFDGYWKLVNNKTLSSSNGGRISEAYTLSSGFSASQAYSLAETLGVKLSTEIGGPFAKVSAEVNASLTETFSNAQTITETDSNTTTYNFGESNPNGIPFAAGIYQLMGQYTVDPSENLQDYIEYLEQITPDKFMVDIKPSISYANDNFRLIQIDYIGPAIARNLNAEVVEGGFHLTWDHSEFMEEYLVGTYSYELYRDGKLIDSVLNTKSYTDELDYSEMTEPHEYSVRLITPFLGEMSDPITVPATIIKNLNAQVIEGGVQLTWDLLGNLEEYLAGQTYSFAVYRDGELVNETIEKFYEQSLEPSDMTEPHEYSVRLIAPFPVGTSNPVTISALGTTAKNVNAETVEGGIQLTWDHAEIMEQYFAGQFFNYQIYRDGEYVTQTAYRSFTHELDPSEMSEPHEYSVRLKVYEGGDTIFTGEFSAPVTVRFEGVYLFEDVNYGGRVIYFDEPGQYMLEDFDFENQLSSYIIIGDYRLVLGTDIPEWLSIREVYGSDPDLRDDVINTGTPANDNVDYIQVSR
ncbi:hypothetical protein [Chengkuizengella sediminis]|uniref:hypothetical protein n=1 Tax=Chengkuizengella sediminis TaxID=1885917 RepID=UPI001389C6C9|nr:hypothetical protein [Chengkuizengella sediminis]NDI33150.1 hypothetical protein [Chengkuizengella sediminis]